VQGVAGSHSGALSALSKHTDVAAPFWADSETAALYYTPARFPRGEFTPRESEVKTKDVSLRNK
jgi:hypothetical protein